MGKKKIAKKTNPKNQKIPTPKCAKTQQKLDRKKRVRARNIVQKGEPKEPPRKTGARGCLISPPIDERMLKPPVYPDSVGCETDQSSRESEESVNKPSGSHGSKRKSVASTAAILESINKLIQIMKNKKQADRESRKEALRKLNCLPIFRDKQNHEIQELRRWAYRLLENNIKVDIFLSFSSTDVGRQTWLYFENRAALAEYRTGHAKEGALPPPRFPPPPYDEFL